MEGLYPGIMDLEMPDPVWMIQLLLIGSIELFCTLPVTTIYFQSSQDGKTLNVGRSQTSKSKPYRVLSEEELHLEPLSEEVVFFLLLIFTYCLSTLLFMKYKQTMCFWGADSVYFLLH